MPKVKEVLEGEMWCCPGCHALTEISDDIDTDSDDTVTAVCQCGHCEELGDEDRELPDGMLEWNEHLIALNANNIPICVRCGETSWLANRIDTTVPIGAEPERIQPFLTLYTLAMMDDICPESDKTILDKWLP